MGFESLTGSQVETHLVSEEHMSKTLYSITSLKLLLEKEKPSRVCIVTSRKLLQKLKWAVKEIPHTDVAILPEGEGAKSWEQIKKLLQQFIKLRLDRKSIIIAFGGGTVGDAAGFASSIYLRGIRYIQIPTTLLAQVDSAHGDKTGINFLNYKNQIGSFYAPLATVIDTRFLKSLSKEQLVDGLGEIIKAGLIKDASILSLLRKERLATLAESPGLESLVKKSIAVKQFYVKADPREHGLRQILNAGHTVGHAVELKYKLSHGKSVFFGLLKEISICESLRLTPHSIKKNLEALLHQLGIHVQANLSVNWKSLVHDKKVSNGVVILPVIEKEGKSKLLSIQLSTFKKYLKI